MSVPKLRFKEFKDNWEVKKLKDLTEILRCGIASTPIYVEEGVPFLSAQNVNANGQIVLDKYNFISEEFYEKISKNHELSNGDLLYSRVGASFGNSAVFQLDGKYGVYVSLTHIRPNKKLLNFFLNFFLNSNNGKKQAKNGVFQGGGVPNLNVKIVEKFEIPFPTIKEQTKIADFFMAVDEKIAQLTQKCELLARYKKGVMQQLFSQDLRFKDDSDRAFPEWEEKTLGQIAQIVGGGTPDTMVAEYWQGEIQWFTPTEMKTKYVSNSLRTITNIGLNNSSAKKLPTGTILFSSRATVGEVSITLNECTTNQGFQSFIVNEFNNNEFIYYWILSNKNSFIEKASGSTFLEISKKEIEKLPIKRPSLFEQIKIANFLTSIDEKISQAQTYLDTVKQYKQGLLQQMFV